MEGFCRGCLVKCNEPTDLIPYSEKNRRLFIYSTGLQVKRNDTFTFQLCKGCYLYMKESCTFKKQCRSSEKKWKNYISMKENGDVIDFCSYIKSCEDLLTIRLPPTSGNSTPAHHKSNDDDNDSTCTSIRNFMSDILEGEEVPDTEARIIKELIEEEADVLDDSLDSHWLQDDMSIATEFRMDFNFSPFSTPQSIQNDHCYTPRRLNDEKDDCFTLRQCDKSPDDKYDMPILDEYEIDIDQPADIPVDELKTDCNTQKNDQNYEIDCKIDNVKLILENQNQEVNNTDKISFDIKNEEQYFVEEITEIEPNEIREDDFLHIGEKTEEYIALTDVENDYYHITKNSSEFKVENEIDESLLNNELEYYISKAELKKKSTVVDNECLIDKNLEKALENDDNKEIPLDILLLSPKVDIRSGASTPTIRNILFGDSLDSNDSPKLSQCIEKYHPIEGQTDILDDFLKDEDSNNIGNVKMKEEIPDISLNCLDLVKHKIEILDIKVIKEKDIENQDRDKNLILDSTNKFIGNNLQRKEETENITDLIEDYVTNVYEKIDITEQDIPDEEIDPLELLRATNATLDDSIFKRPLSPMYDKYDLEKSQCKICNQTFKTQTHLKIHFAKKHKFKIVGSKKSYHDKVEICDICGQTVKGKANLNRHKKIAHEGSFSCTECLQQFSTQHGLNVHKSSHKGNLLKNTTKNTICNICGKRVSKPNYKIHVKRHLKDFKIKCEICDKGFFKNGELDDHMRKHTKNRPFKCSICPKSYRRRFSLQRHVKQHFEKQEFICDICSQIFTSKSKMRHHFGTKLCMPAQTTSMKQRDIADKTSCIIIENVFKTSNINENLSVETSEKQLNSVNNILETQRNSTDKTSEITPDISIEITEEQHNSTYNTSKNLRNSTEKTSEIIIKNPNKTSEMTPDISKEQYNSTEKTSEIISNAFKTSDTTQNIPTDKPEQTITEEIEFTVTFSPISFKEDTPSDPIIDLY